MAATTITIDKAGRVIVPKALRDSLHIKAGDQLEIFRDGESLKLRPSPAQGKLRRLDGMWVWDSGSAALTQEMVDETLEQLHEEQHRRVLGE